MFANLDARSTLLSVAIFVVGLLIWHAATHVPDTGPIGVQLSQEQRDTLLAANMSGEDIDTYAAEGVAYAQLEQIANLGLSRAMIEAAGGIRALGISVPDENSAPAPGSLFPSPALIGKELWATITDPFYVNGTNDMGFGIQMGYSLLRVVIGYTLAAAVAIPLGFLIGMSPLFFRALDPYIQVLKPISPLAWMPIALFTIGDSELSSLFVIFICSLWPMLTNTAFGVANVRSDWVNVARTHELGSMRTALTVILPAAAPTIITGMRISIGIAWLVIVAAEMLVGGTGIGYVVWNEWNGLRLDRMIVAILFIGVVGMLLDAAFARLQRAVAYSE
ncbi:nitrate ABC transporter permease [Actibacterium mucosum KCTC 23349]|uniref:Nitrate ABC transporter permease n=1 Tax=Actibacterium mucosum KCTC 23349 TaxID=1454373 RepID=A0A037ZMA4_9RHOB|nr:nitrate ABC transporter permease [Actibacterium mucosum]KAJ55906.1 nitrate ABC transporter permease [Actibacterium mucosum KCTC 23349]